MSKIWKQTLSMILVCVMVIGMLPTQVFAVGRQKSPTVSSVQAQINALATEVGSAAEAEALKADLEAVTDAIAELTTQQAAQLDMTNYDAATAALEAWTRESYTWEELADNYVHVIPDSVTPKDLIKQADVKLKESNLYTDVGGDYYWTKANADTQVTDGSKWSQIKVKNGVFGFGADPDSDLDINVGDTIHVAKMEETGGTYTYTDVVIYTVVAPVAELTANDRAEVRFNPCKDVSVTDQLETLRSEILKQLNVQFDGLALTDSEDVTIQYFPWKYVTLIGSGEFSGTDKMRNLDAEAPGDETVFVVGYSYRAFGERFRNGDTTATEKVLITYKGLSVTAQITLVDGRKEYTINWADPGVTFETQEEIDAAVIKQLENLNPGRQIKATVQGTPDLTAVKTISYDVTVAENAEYKEATGMVTISVTAKENPAQVNFEIQGNGTVTVGSLNNSGTLIPGTYTITATAAAGNDKSVVYYLESVTVTCGGEKITPNEDGTYTLEAGKTYTVSAKFGTASVALKADQTAYINRYSYETKIQNIKNIILSAVLEGYSAENVGDYTVVVKGIMEYNLDNISGYNDAQKNFFNIALGESSLEVTVTGKHGETATVEVKLVESRSEANITVGEIGTITVTNGWDPVTDAVNNAAQTDLGEVTKVVVTEGTLPTLENPEVTVTVTITVAETVEVLATTKTVEVTVKLAQYTVTWVDGNGDTLKTDSVYYGGKPAYTGKTPTKTATVDKVFTWNEGWEVTEGSDNVNADGSIYGAVTYTATFTDASRTYTITFDANGGQFKADGKTTKTFEKAYGQKTEKPLNDPEREGYNFAGWGEVADTVTGDVTYYAQWTKAHVITFQNGNDKTTQIVSDGEKATEPVLAEVENMRFMGWFEAGATEAFDFNTPITESLTLVAKWVADYNHNGTDDNTEPHYTIIYKGEGIATETYENILVGMGTPAYKGTLERNGYIFNGWDKVIADKVTDNVTYTAQWEEDANNNGIADKYETAIVQIKVTGNGTVTITGAEGLVVTALGDGKYRVVFDSTATNGNRVNLVAKGTETGSTTSQNVLTKQDVTELELENGKTYEVTAEFTLQSFSIHDGTIRVNKYKLLGASERINGLKEKILNAAVGAGLNADGYTVVVDNLYNLDSSSQTGLSTLLLLNSSITATITEKATGLYGQVTITLTEEREAATITIESKQFTADTYEQFKDLVENAVKITDNAGNVITDESSLGKKLKEATITPVDNATFPTIKDGVATYTVTVKATYDGEKWLEGEQTFEVTVKVNCYEVTWIDGNGNTIYSEEVPCGQMPVFDKDKNGEPTKTATATEQYRWNGGWNSEPVAVNGKVSYQAAFTTLYVVYWDIDGNGSVDETTYVAAGEKPTAPAAADKSGQNLHFAGWTPELTEVTGAGSTYTATYSEDIIYTITFLVDGTTHHTQVINLTQYPNTTIAQPGQPSKSGFLFNGWVLTDGNGQIGKVPTANATFTAQWAQDDNGNGKDDAKETVTITVNVIGKEYGTVTLSGAGKTKIIAGENGTYTVIFDSTVTGGNVLTVTATAAEGNSYTKYELKSLSADSITLSAGATYTVSAEFTKAELVLAENATVYVNKYTILDPDERIDGLKAKIVAALLGASVGVDNYTVTIDVTVDLGFTSSTTRYDLDRLTSSSKTVVSALLLGSSITVTVKDKTTGLSREARLAVAESRATLEVNVPESITIESKNALTKEQVEQQIREKISLIATDPQTGNKTPVTDYTITILVYQWPEDGKTKTYTVTITILNTEQYSNSITSTTMVDLICVDTTKLYTITWNSNGGKFGDDSTSITQIITEDDVITAPEIVREYYRFNGWNTDGGTIGQKPTKDVTFTATWKAELDNNGNGVADQEETYEIRYTTGYGANQVIESYTACWGENTPTLPEELMPTQFGFNFAGWSPDFQATVRAPEEGTTITYTAKWTLQHAVIFDDRGTQDTQLVENGKTLIAPQDPVWDEDHDFLGWYYGSQKYDFDLPVTSSFTLIAKWREDFNHNDIDDAEEPHYTVTYVLGNGEANRVFESILTGLATPTISKPTRTGYIFKGWDAEIADTVTDNVTYTAVWARDVNSNGVDDANETISIVVTTAGDEDKITVTGAVQVENTNSWVYDSTNSNVQLTILATPTTTLDLLTRYSDSYVYAILIGGENQKLSYNSDFSTQISAVPNNGMQIDVIFADAALLKNENPVLSYYPGMTGVTNRDVYHAAIKEPVWSDSAQIIVEYLARQSGETVYINIDKLTFSDNSTLDSLIKSALKGIYSDGKISIEQSATWVTLDKELTMGDYADVDSYEELVNGILNERLDEIPDIFNEAYENAGNSIAGLLAGGQAVYDALLEIIEGIEDSAKFYGAHEFGYNASTSQDTTEIVRISYKDAARNIQATQMTITLHDSRIPTQIIGNDASLVYKDFLDEQLAEKMGILIKDKDGNIVEGTLTLTKDSLGLENANVSDNAYTITFRFAGNEIYKPSEASFQVTIVKAGASMSIDGVFATYGEEYSVKHNIITKNAYGNPQEIEDSLIKFIIGLNVADLKVDGSGVSGIDTVIQLLLPDNLKSGLTDIMGGLFDDGVEMSLSDLVKYLELIDADSLGVLKQALEAIIELVDTADVTIKLGGKLPENVGAYLYGAVSTSGNYETVLGVTYIIVKPDAQRVYLDWNYNTTKGMFTHEMLQNMDLGASAFNDELFTELNKEASNKIYNLFFGVNKGEDNKPALMLKLYEMAADPESFETDLGNGIFTQLAFVAEFGNKMYYAVPIVRAFAIVPNTVKVEFTDEEGTDFKRTYDSERQEVTITVNGEIVETGLEVTYIGVTTKGQTYHSNVAPTEAGAYVITAVYCGYIETGKLAQIGMAVQELIVQPAKTETEVDNKIITVGEKVEIEQIVHITVDGTVAAPDLTIITAQIATDGSFSENGWSAIKGNLNLDLPTWVDEILAQNAPELYQGVTAARLSEMVNGKIKTLIAQLELDQELSGSLYEILDQVNDLLQKLPENVTVTFEDIQPTKTFAQVGVYLVGALVTDSNYWPSADFGFVVVKPDVTKVYLDWNHHDENGIWSEELIKNADLYASAFDDADFQNKNDGATEKITHIFLTVDKSGAMKIYRNAEDLPHGAYLELAYIALELDGHMTISDLIARPIVTTANVAKVEFIDENGEANRDRQFTYDGKSHEMKVRITCNGQIMMPTAGELVVTYRGMTTAGVVYNSTEAPVDAGVYTVTAVYTHYEGDKLICVGMDVGVMVIKPAQIDFSITGGMVEHDGNKHSVTVDTANVEYTLISGMVNFDGNITEIGLQAITANLNVDFPAWVDKIIAERFPDAYANGIDADKLLTKLEQYRDALIEAGIRETWLDQIVSLLEQIPSEVKVTFADNVAFTEPGVYAFAGIVTDFNYVPTYDTALLVIQKVDSGLSFEETTIDYDGSGHLVDVVNGHVTDYVTVIVDRENNIANILFEDDLIALKALLEQLLDKQIPEQINVTQLMQMINEAIAKLQAIENLPVDIAGVLNELKALVDKLPQTGTIYLDGQWRPVDVGSYEFYGISVSPYYQTKLLQAILTITPKQITRDDVQLDGSLTYNGQTQTQQIKVTEGITYEVTGNIATNAGGYTLSVTGTGNYTGTVELSWNIAKAKVTVTVEAAWKFIDEADPAAYPYGVTGLMAGDSLNVKVTRVQGNEAGDYNYQVSYTPNDNYEVEVINKECFTIKKYEIVFDNAQIDTVQIDGVEYSVKDGVAYVETSTKRIAQTILYDVNESYPVGMYLWYLCFDGNERAYTAHRIQVLETLMCYEGTSILVNDSQQNGIRFFYTVSDAYSDLIDGGEIEHMDGWKVIDAGVKVTKDDISVEYSAKDQDVYATWMNLGKQKKDLIDQFTAQSYITLSNTQETIVIYGGKVQRSIYDVAKQNVGWNVEWDTENVFQKCIQQIISTVDEND